MLQFEVVRTYQYMPIYLWCVSRAPA